MRFSRSDAASGDVWLMDFFFGIEVTGTRVRKMDRWLESDVSEEYHCKGVHGKKTVGI